MLLLHHPVLQVKWLVSISKTLDRYAAMFRIHWALKQIKFITHFTIVFKAVTILRPVIKPSIGPPPRMHSTTNIT